MDWQRPTPPTGQTESFLQTLECHTVSWFYLKVNTWLSSVLLLRSEARGPSSCPDLLFPALDVSLQCGPEMSGATGNSCVFPSLVKDELFKCNLSLFDTFLHPLKILKGLACYWCWMFAIAATLHSLMWSWPFVIVSSPQPCCSLACSGCHWRGRTSAALVATPPRSCASDGCSWGPSTLSWETTMTG